MAAYGTEAGCENPLMMLTAIIGEFLGEEVREGKEVGGRSRTGWSSKHA